MKNLKINKSKIYQKIEIALTIIIINTSFKNKLNNKINLYILILLILSTQINNIFIFSL